jgi:hypothetical protein
LLHLFAILVRELALLLLIDLRPGCGMDYIGYAFGTEKYRKKSHGLRAVISPAMPFRSALKEPLPWMKRLMRSIFKFDR